MVLRHVSILKDHPQGVSLCLAKVTELFKRLEEFLKFKKLNLDLDGTVILPEDDLLRSKHVGVLLNIFMYFSEINTLD